MTMRRGTAPKQPTHAEILDHIRSGLEALTVRMEARFDSGDQRMSRIEASLRDAVAQSGAHDARIAAAESAVDEQRERLSAVESQAAATTGAGPWWRPYMIAGAMIVLSLLAGAGLAVMLIFGVVDATEIAAIVSAVRGATN